VIATPPVNAGAVHATVTRPSPAVPATPVGAPGTDVVGVTPTDAADATDVPCAFVALTVKVTGTPPGSPVTVQGLVDELQVNAPGADVAVYEVIADPPDAGAVQETAAEPDPATATTTVGALGTVAGVPKTVLDVAPLPEVLIARNTTVYNVPLRSPVLITNGDTVDTGLRVIHAIPPLMEY